MNLKLDNDEPVHLEPTRLSAAEERRRTGRYIAILVAISLVCLAIYHAWVRRVPVMASLLVPALIMLLYIAWVLYTASRDKRKAEAHLERCANAAIVAEEHAPPLAEPPAPPSPPSPRAPLDYPRRSYSIA